MLLPTGKSLLRSCDVVIWCSCDLFSISIIIVILQSDRLLNGENTLFHSLILPETIAPFLKISSLFFFLLYNWIILYMLIIAIAQSNIVITGIIYNQIIHTPKLVIAKKYAKNHAPNGSLENDISEGIILGVEWVIVSCFMMVW